MISEFEAFTIMIIFGNWSTFYFYKTLLSNAAFLFHRQQNLNTICNWFEKILALLNCTMHRSSLIKIAVY